MGRPLVRWVVSAAKQAGAERIVAVVGHCKEQVIPLVQDETEIVVQPDRKGTADAVAVCREALADFDGSLLVLSGDCPLITASQPSSAWFPSARLPMPLSPFSTMKLPDPDGDGRIIRNDEGNVVGIVEQKLTQLTTRPLSRSATPAFIASIRSGCSRPLPISTTTTRRASSTCADVYRFGGRAGSRRSRRDHRQPA